MKEEKIREAFAKAKQDILNLQLQLHSMKQDIQEIKQILNKQIIRRTDTSTDLSTQNSTQKSRNAAIRQINQTETITSTQNSTHNMPQRALKTKISNVSIRNQGVSTDRQTDRQTDTSTGNKGVKVRLTSEFDTKFDRYNKLADVKEIISSLDDIKKTLRGQIKKLTNQEMSVFTSIYQLEEEGFSVDYNLLSKRLNLTESSIRDYVQRITKKGIPIQKTKENNKKVLLSVSTEFKKIASLTTILQLRDL